MTNPNEHQPRHFFVDAKKYDAPKESMTALEIKTQAGVPANYQLFLEEQGDTPDRAISDSESFVIGTPPLHFYAVPPATFGAQ